MLRPTSLLYKPTLTVGSTTASRAYAYLPRLSLKKQTVSSLQFPSSKSLFSSQKPVSLYKRPRTPNTMRGSNKISVSGGTIGDEGVGSFEQEESFINGSSEFRLAVGFESTLNRLSKWVVTASFAALLLWRHDAEALWAAMGAVANTGFSTILKQVLNQERPGSTSRSDPGMPSNHAQSFFFSIIYVVVSMFQWLGANGLTITLAGLALAVCSYLSWLRVSQELHTISQVVVGAVLGSSLSILWFWSWSAIVLNAYNSYLWVRILVVLGGVGFFVGFFIHVILHWVIDR